MKKNTWAFSLINKFQLAAIAAVGLAVAMPAYANSTYQVQGEKGLDNNSCNFTMSVTLPRGKKAFEARQVGFDAKTCTITMERIDNPSITSDASVSTNLKSKQVQQEAPLPATQNLVNPGITFRTRVLSRSYWTNPFGVFQHHVKDGVEYSYNFSRVFNALCIAPGDGLQWRFPTWRLIANTRQTCRYNNVFFPTTITASTGAQYFSPARAYCGVGTNILYNRHRTIGRANGDATDIVNFGGSSGCLSLLRLRHQFFFVF